jgi:hypothetical protein
MKNETRIKKAFNEYNGKNPEVLDKFYHEDVVFEDPITRVEGIEELKKYYKHAYGNVKSIEFVFKNIIESGENYTCEWDMILRAKMLNFGKEISVRGLSLLTFDAETSKVIKHHDYLDLGDMVYERVPVVSTLIKALKSQLS